MRPRVALLLAAVLAAPLSAQRAFTADDYARAERFLSYNTAPLVYRADVRPTGLPDGRFWYRNTLPEGHEFVLVDSLIAANKDFDLLVLPNRRHGFGNEPYMIRRRWDYFVRNLLGAEPPAGYELHRPAPALRRRP